MTGRLGARQPVAPDGDWRLWLVMAGRGFGKTRMGAEWVRMVAQSDPWRASRWSPPRWVRRAA
jgi:phage terminase large subunit-like protein